jgi:epoxyqueuosine reductase
MMDTESLTRAIKIEARRLGFDACRILPIRQAAHADFYEAWVEAERPGEMRYLARHMEKRRDPALLADRKHGPFNSLIVLAVNYHHFDLPPHLRDDPLRGIIASYAWGDDYHEIMRPLLYALDAFIRDQNGRTALGKGLVDTGPVLERDWAARAGIGFTGKNCCTIHPHEGSWLFLATLLVPETLTYDPEVAPPSAPLPAEVLMGLPPSRDYGRVQIPLFDDTTTGATGTCGRCTRCLDACPTEAFTGPYHLDPRRCISYWTIETQSPIPRALRARFGNRIFGCDICQEVCPWNQRLAERAPLLTGLLAQADRIAPPLCDGFDPAHPYWLDDAAFAARFDCSPILRATRLGMARNVAVALGNSHRPEAIAPLRQLLADASPTVRGHASWGLGEILRALWRYDPTSQTTIRSLLQEARGVESDPAVQEEIHYALNTE